MKYEICNLKNSQKVQLCNIALLVSAVALLPGVALADNQTIEYINQKPTIQRGVTYYTPSNERSLKCLTTEARKTPLDIYTYKTTSGSTMEFAFVGGCSLATNGTAQINGIYTCGNADGNADVPRSWRYCYDPSGNYSSPGYKFKVSKNTAS